MIEIFALNDLIVMQPRRVMKYMLVWCASGSVDLVVDDNEFQLGPHEVITITSGQYHYFKKAIDATGYILTFTYDFFCKDETDIELIFHNGLFCHFDRNELIKVDLSVLLTQLKQEADAKAYQYQIFSHSIIELLLITINRAKISRGDEIWKPNALFLRFLDMIRTSFGSNLPLIQIAAKLGTTVIKLNELSKQHAGKTAQNVFHGLIASEAKRLIIYEKLTVKEIAYSLGFSDPFYFSAFFKKHTGHSPKAYREKHMVF